MWKPSVSVMINPPSRLVALLALLSLSVAPERAAAQSPTDLFKVLGEIVDAWDHASGSFAVGGFASGDALRTPSDGVLREVSLMLVDDDAEISVGVDVLTGFEATDESLSFTGSIRGLPSFTKYFSFPAAASSQLNVGLTVGLSQLWNARAIAAAPERLFEVSSTGVHAGASLGGSFAVGTFGFFVEGAVRHTHFPTLDWKTGKDSVVPPVGWPLSIGLVTGVLRFGIGANL